MYKKKTEYDTRDYCFNLDTKTNLPAETGPDDAEYSNSPNIWTGSRKISYLFQMIQRLENDKEDSFENEFKVRITDNN